MSPAIKTFMYCLPVAAGAFFVFQPSVSVFKMKYIKVFKNLKFKGIMYYIACSNIYSLCVASVLKLELVRKRFGLPDIKKEIEAQSLAKKNEKSGFVSGMMDSYKNLRLLNELENRKKYKIDSFNKSGLGLPVKTFKENPMKKIE